MPLIGKVIKAAIGLGSKFQADVDPVVAQEEVLKKLLSTAHDTEFGRKQKFLEILNADNPREAFRGTVGIYDYDRLYEEAWKKVIDGEENITWPGTPEYFAVSSGTTGAKKRIPVTDDMIQSIRDTGIRQILSLDNFDLPDEFFEKEILMFGSSTNLKENEGRLEGQISGISASRIPFWFRGIYKPGEDIASIDDWDKRVEKLAEAAPGWDIGAISGIPTWLEQVLEKVVEYNDLENVHEIWPNLEVFASGGVAFEPYRKSIEKWLERPLIYIDTYLASEGFFAFQSRPETDSMALVVDDAYYFEFLPFVEENFDDTGAPMQDADALHLGEVEEGEEYVLLISTVSGAWRYSIGDTIVVTNKEKAEIRITGRTKHFLNVAGSELSVDNMQQCIEKMEEAFGVSIPEFTVAAIEKGDGYVHRWYFGVDDGSNLDEDKLSKKFDACLQEQKDTYKTARNKQLHDPELIVVSDDVFYAYTEKMADKGGQTKIPRVMDDEKFEHWERFVREES